MSAYGQYIRFPSATTLNPGAGLFVLDNSRGTVPVGVLDGAGQVLGQIIPGTITSFSLRSIATAAGEWVADTGNLDPWWIDSNTPLEIAAQNTPQFFGLDSTRSLITYKNKTNGYPCLRMVTYGAAGVAPTISAELVLRAANTTLNNSLVKLIGTTRLLCFTNDNQVMVVDISNASTLSVGSSAALTFTSASFQDFVVLDAQYVQALAIDNTSYVLRAKCIDCGTSGTTVTVGSEASSAAFSSGSGYLADFRARGTSFSGIYGFAYNPGGYADLWFYSLTRTSGTTLSFSAKLGNPTGLRTDNSDQPYSYFWNIATDKMMVPYYANNYGGRYVVVTFAASSTPTYGTVTSSTLASNIQNLGYITAPDLSRFVAYNQNNSGARSIEAVTVSGTTVTVASTTYTADSTVASSTPFVGIDNNGRGIINWTSSFAQNVNQRDRFRTFSLSGTTFTFGTESVGSFYGGFYGQTDSKSIGILDQSNSGIFYIAGARYSGLSYRYKSNTEFFTINSDLSRNVLATVFTDQQYLQLYGANGITNRMVSTTESPPPTNVPVENFVVFTNGLVKRGQSMFGLASLSAYNAPVGTGSSTRYMPGHLVYPDNRQGRNSTFVTYQFAEA